MALKVYWIDPKISLDPRSRPQRQNPDLVLKLMPLAAGVDCLTWLSHYPETTSPDGIPPFTYNDDLSIFALFFHFQFYKASLPHSHPPPNFLLLVSVRELLRILDLLRSSESIDVPQPPHRNLRIEWDAWGPSAARLIAFKHPIWNTMPPVSRTRCAVAIRGTARNDPHFNYVLLLSAHPHAALSNRGGPGARVVDSDAQGGGPQSNEDREEAAMVAEFVTCEDAIVCPKVFRTSIHTTLPASVRCKRVPRPHGREVAEHVEIGLFEDGLSLMYLYEADGAMRWDMFTFSV